MPEVFASILNLVTDIFCVELNKYSMIESIVYSDENSRVLRSVDIFIFLSLIILFTITLHLTIFFDNFKIQLFELINEKKLSGCIENN